MKNKEPEIIYYDSYSDDIVESKNQNIKINDKFKWIHTNFIYKIFSRIVYLLARFFSLIYCRLYLHVKVENKQLLKDYKQTGYFIYGNHTLPMGDVFNPTQAIKGKRFYIIANEANLGIPVIGKILPMLGALIIPENIKQMKEFLNAVNTRIEEKKSIIIYPEAHVWPYYTKIRSFDETSFKFPIQLNVPSFCMTTTYYKRKEGKKPGIKIYIDGPFFPDETLSLKDRKSKLCNDIHTKMQERSESFSTYEYLKYERRHE